MPSYLSPGVYVEELEPATRPIEGVGTAVAAFVGLAGSGPMNSPTLVTNWTQFTTLFGPPLPGTYLGAAVYGYFLNGGGQAYIVRVGWSAHPVADAQRGVALPAAVDDSAASYLVSAVTPGSTATVEVVDPPPDSPADTFGLRVRAGDQEETFGPLTARRGRYNAVTTVNQQSTLVRLTEAPSQLADRRPAPGTVTISAPPPEVVGTRIEEYIGDVAERTGFGSLDAVDTVTMVLAPDLMSAYAAGAIDGDGVRAVQAAMIAHCEQLGDRMAILDTPPDLSPQQVHQWRTDTAGYDSKYAALYYPWLQTFDPDTGTTMNLPPSGHLAGVWARNDATRGVHKAPANEVIRGALGTAIAVTRGEHDLLNPVGVNCIRAFAGRGVRVWGARTLSSDPAWCYVNVRRLYNYVESSLLAGTQWVVFEPNDKSLWERLIRTIRAFLFTVWLDGGLVGTTVDQAFYVKCDDETNPAETIEAGSLVCEIGLAVVRPAEFVVFRLAQLAAGSSAVTE